MNFLIEELVNLPQVRVENVVREGQVIFLKLGFKDDEIVCPHCGKRRAS